MCRSIQRLHQIQPPAGPDEIRAAALQYVRKISGYRKPSRANQAAFDAAVDAIAAASTGLLAALQSNPRWSPSAISPNDGKPPRHIHPQESTG